jgi:hypothetical protein
MRRQKLSEELERLMEDVKELWNWKRFRKLVDNAMKLASEIENK